MCSGGRRRPEAQAGSGGRLGVELSVLRRWGALCAVGVPWHSPTGVRFSWSGEGVAQGAETRGRDTGREAAAAVRGRHDDL